MLSVLPFAFLILPATVLVAHARSIVRKDAPHTYGIAGGTVFAPNWATCANDPSVQIPFGNTAAITVRPDCDTAIDIVCKVATADYTKGRQMRNLKASSGSPNACEVNILFSQPKLADVFSYEICVKGFQDITTQCMLLGEDAGPWAAPAAQAGVTNAVYTQEGGAGNSTYPMMKASTQFNLKPAYMAGPPGYFGPGGISYGLDVSGTYG
ncbi:MAG: hypothetical protein L6R39_000309 [Caloplaca ligustica]|nr:MAG: hypothetical protein L6R39_000309 [Caloplaca ligustica]